MGGEFRAESKNPTPNKAKLRPVPAGEGVKKDSLKTKTEIKSGVLCVILDPNEVIRLNMIHSNLTSLESVLFQVIKMQK